MMEEDDVSKIAKELQEAALTDVTQASIKEASPSLLISDNKKESTPPKVSEVANPAPLIPIETLVSSIPSVGFESSPSVSHGKMQMVPLQSTQNFPGSTFQSSYHQSSYHQSSENSHFSMPGYNDPVAADDHPNTVPQAQHLNPYRAVSGLASHVPGPGHNALPNIFVPPFVQETPKPTYQSSLPSYSNITQYGSQHSAFPHDDHSTCGGDGHSHGYHGGGGESFLEIPQDPSAPAWDGGTYQQHHHHHQASEGLLGWFSNVGNRVFEKTKSSVESMITTLDPGMKAVLYSGGDVDIVVTSLNNDLIEGIRQAFQEIFGRATVNGIEARSDIATQPVGFTAGLRGAENKIENLRRSRAVHEYQPLVSIENFIHEVFPDKWFEFSCLVLKDPMRNVDLTTFTQATPINPTYIQQAQESTPNDYELRWSGLSITIGEVIGRNFPHIHPLAWQKELAGVSKRESVYGAAKVLASLYKHQCH